MRLSLVVGLLVGLLAGLFLSGQVATSQEDLLPLPGAEGRGRYQIAGHSTYPPLLLDSETGTSWILMSTAEGEDRHWVWERFPGRQALTPRWRFRIVENGSDQR
jgi:hypothetical protein